MTVNDADFKSFDFNNFCFRQRDFWSQQLTQFVTIKNEK